MQKHRRSLRLQGFDYTTPTAYFVTLVTWHRVPLFGQIHAETMLENPLGNIARIQWQHLETRFENVWLDEFVIMPNHVHAIILIGQKEPDRPNVHRVQTTTPALGTIIAAYKSTTTRIIRQTQNPMQNLVWQRNYYDHIIRNDTEWERIRLYIQTNPSNWAQDNENPIPRSP